MAMILVVERPTAKIPFPLYHHPLGHVSVSRLFISKAGANQPSFDVLGHSLTPTNISMQVTHRSPDSERIDRLVNFERKEMISSVR